MYSMIYFNYRNLKFESFSHLKDRKCQKSEIKIKFSKSEIDFRSLCSHCPTKLKNR